MKCKGYLIVSQTGSLRAVKSIKSSLGPDEIAIAINLEIPDIAFKPLIQAEIKISEKDVTPLLINTGKLNKMQDVLSNEIGLKVILKSVGYEKKSDGK